MYKRTLISLVAMLALASAARADETPSWIMDTSGIGKSNNGVVRSDQLLELGVASPNALQLEGESALRMGNLDRALVALQRSVELAPMDMDKRILYAQCLEKKLIKQQKRDPQLFNFLVKQWLFIAKKAEFPDQAVQGRMHLYHMTGRLPKPFEKIDKYLASVLMPEDGSEPVKMGRAKQLAAAAAERKDKEE